VQNAVDGKRAAEQTRTAMRTASTRLADLGVVSILLILPR